MITLTGVSKFFDTANGRVAALQDIHLTVAAGEVMGIIGRSGAGKSTLLRCINLLERPCAGEVIVGGQSLLTLSPVELSVARQRMGMVFQHFNLLSRRTVYDNVALPLLLRGASSSDIAKVILPLLDYTGLVAHRDAYPHQLSGGQKQRVGIARALTTSPRVMLCDEMTSALDPETTEDILQLVSTIARDKQIAVVMITHEMGVVKSIADRVAVMDRGKMVEQTDIVSLFQSPQSAIGQAFTDSVMHTAVPASIAQCLVADYTADAQQIVRIAFVARNASRPVMQTLMQHYSVGINILQANIEHIGHESIGKMVVALSGTQTAMADVIAAMQAQSLGVEELGYVTADDWLSI